MIPWHLHKNPYFKPVELVSHTTVTSTNYRRSYYIFCGTAIAYIYLNLNFFDFKENIFIMTYIIREVT